MIDVDIARLQNLECGKQLRARKLGAPRIGIGQRRQRARHAAHHALILQRLAIARFHRPDRQQDVAADAVLAFNTVKPRPELGSHLPTGGDGVFVHTVIEIFPWFSTEFRLVPCLLEHFWIRRCYPAERAVIRCSGNSILKCDLAKFGDPTLKARIGEHLAGAEYHQESGEGEPECGEGPTRSLCKHNYLHYIQSTFFADHGKEIVYHIYPPNQFPSSS